MNLAVIGLGYVGASFASVASLHYEVRGFDIDIEKARKVADNDYSFLGEREDALLRKLGPSVKVAETLEKAIEGADFIVVSVPTDYQASLSRLDTSVVDGVVKKVVAIKEDATIVIKSTVPIGFCDSLQSEYPDAKILFSPEFLREDHSVEDTLSPSRIIVGSKKENEAKSLQFLDILSEIACNSPAERIYMSLLEAESVKLFSNTYLALRVAYFNELDTFALSKGMDPKKVVRGVCLDPRIGEHYNNPSFGYGGYCLPKDSKQLFASYEGVPEELVRSTIASNSLREDFIFEETLKKVEEKEDPIIGIYHLTQKKGASSIRASPSLSLLRRFVEAGFRVKVYEPLLEGDGPYGSELSRDLEAFLNECDLILANRLDENLKGHLDKVFSRDLYGVD